MLSKLRRRKPIEVVLPSLEELVAAADDEEKITSIIPNAEEQSLVSSPTSTTPIATQLFNRQRIITYIEQIAKAKLLIQNKQNNEARRILYELKQQYPDYPESYVELGDSFVKDKQADLAVVYYNIAIELAPFDNTTKIKCMLQLQELSKSFEEYIVEPAALNKQLAEAREIKNQEQAYKRWYHSRLRHGLMELNIHSGTPLTDCNAKILDYLDVTLSNGSVLETFQGMQARAHKKYELAEYYFERAIIKHEHDFIAWGNRVIAMLITDTFEGDEFIETTKVIDTYRYSLAYFTRFMLYCDTHQDDLAYQDLVAFLCGADHPEFTGVQGYRKGVLSFLSTYSDPEKKIITECIDVDSADAGEILKTLPDVLSGKSKSNIDGCIKIVNSLIQRSPENADHYRKRGVFYENKKYLMLANVNYSLAIWLGDVSQLNSYFYHRAKVNLQLGRASAADHDFENTLLSLKQITKNNYPAEKLATLMNIAEMCLNVGRQLSSEAQHVSAQSVFHVGINRILQITADYMAAEAMGVDLNYHSNVLAALHIERAEDMRAQGRSMAVMRDYIFNAMMSYWHWHPEPMATLRQKFEYYAKKNSDIERKKDEAKAVEPQFSPAPHAKKPPAEKRINFFKASAPRAKSTASITQYKFPEKDSIVDLTELGLNELVTNKEQIQVTSEDKKLKIKNKQKAKKFYRLKQRKLTRNQETESSSDSDEEPLPICILSAPKTEIKSVTLNDFENKIFKMLFELVPEAMRNNYKVYLGGGWAYDKIRLQVMGIPVCQHNDFDVITDIPIPYLQKLKAISFVTGLYSEMVDNIKIDVKYEPDLSNLNQIAKARDFMSLFIDTVGKIYDPTGFGLLNMLRQQLFSSLPPAEIFKEDPLRILRAIYLSTKRNLHVTTLKKQMIVDRLLLVPRNTDPETGLDEKLLHPHRFNIWIGKLFSQHFATKNLSKLKKKNFQLLEIFFPDICNEIENDFDWIANQVLISNFIPFPKITVIYTAFIASAIAQRAPVLYHNNVLQITEPLLSVTTSIYKNSLLFNDAFKDLTELFKYLQRTLLEWGVQHEPMDYDEVVNAPNSLRLVR